MRAFILAAGRGERMRPLTDQCPKPLIEVAGQTLIERHLRRLADAGVRDCVINLGWLGERIRARLGDGSALGLRIRYSPEGWPALETGGGIRQALPLLGEQPFVMINGDIYTEFALAPLLERARNWPSEARAHLVLVPNPDHHPGGDFSLRDERIIEPPEDVRWTFSGISLIDPRLLAGSEPGRYSVIPLIRAAARAGQVGGELYRGRWSDVGTPERLQTLKNDLSASAA